MKPKKAKIGTTVCDIVEEEKEEDEEIKPFCMQIEAPKKKVSKQE